MQYWNITIRNGLLFSFLLLTFYTASAQENSPYSRYGIGNLKVTENVANRGMGGVSLADDNSLIANPTNPATYTGLKLTSYQVGIEAAGIKIKNSTASYRTGYTTLSYVNIGFSVSKKMGMSFGLMPVSQAKYSMEQSSTTPFSTVTNSYYGGGGLQRIYVGAAYKIDEVSIGINTGLNFGNIVNTTDNKFEDTLKILSNNVTNRTTMNGVFWQVGALWNKKLNEDYALKVGLTYTGNQNLNAKKETYWRTYFGDVSDPLYATSVDSSSNLKGKVKLPSKIGAGVILARGDFWQVGADLNYSDWTNYTSYGNSDSMTSSYMLKLGGSITPDVNSVNNYWKKVTYRLGVYSGKDILQFNNTNLKKSAVTAGIGYPIRRTNSSIGQINASFEVGKRGTIDNGLLREGFTRFAIGFTFNDKWFLKRRYD